MQGDQGERDDNDFGIELQWPAGSGDESAAPGPPPPPGARAVAPAFEPIDPGDGESDRPAVDVRESATSSLGRDHQAVPLLPAMAGRIESVHGAIATLGVRIDALAAASNSFRSVLSDRLSDHVEAMSRLANTQSQELEDYRQANDRIVAELRQVATENEATLRRLSERFDETGAELVAMTGAINALAPAREAAAEGESVATQVTENMEHVGSQILDQVDDLVATNSGVVAEMQALLGRLETAAPTAGAAPATSEHSAELLDALASIEDRLEAADQQQTAQLNELHGLVGRLQASAGTAGAGAGDDVLDALAAIEERLEAADQQQAVQLNELADGIAAIEERIADGAIAVGSATGDQVASGELIEALRSAAAEVQAVGDELRDVRVTVQDLKKTAPAVAGVPAAGGLPSGAFDDLREELQAELTALRDELTQLRRRISVRAKAPAVLEDEQIDAIVEAVAARIEIPSVPSEVNLGKDALDELAARVTERLAESFEVVAEEPPAPAPPPRAPLRAPRKAAPPAPAPASRPRRTR